MTLGFNLFEYKTMDGGMLTYAERLAERMKNK